MDKSKDKVSSGQPVSIQLRTEVFQDGEKSEHFFDVSGNIVKIGSTLYIRYQEQHEDEWLPVTVKIEADGSVQLIRNTENRMRMKFTYQESNYFSYRTPYGLLQVRTFTNNLRVTLKDKPMSGKVSIDYELYAGEEKLGVYHMRLQFTA